MTGLPGRLDFADAGEAADLAAFLARLIHYDRAAAVRLQARSDGAAEQSLAVFGRPPSFEVLAVRSARLAAPVELDITVSAGELLESIDESGAAATVPAPVTGPRGPVCCRPAAAGSSCPDCRRLLRCTPRSRLSSLNSASVQRSCRPNSGPGPNSTGSAGRSGPGRSAAAPSRSARRTPPSRSDSSARSAWRCPTSRPAPVTPARTRCSAPARGCACAPRTARQPCVRRPRWAA